MGEGRVYHTILRDVACRVASLLRTVIGSDNVLLGSLHISKNTSISSVVVRVRTSVANIGMGEPGGERTATLNTTCLTNLTAKI